MMPWTDRLRACMNTRAMSQAQLARALGCTRGAVGHYLAGRRRPTLEQFTAIAEALGVSPAWLQYGDGAQGDGAVRESAGVYSATAALSLHLVGAMGEAAGAADTALAWRLPPHAVAVRVQDDGYAPRLRAQDLVVASADPGPHPGEEVVVRDAQDRFIPYILRQLGERLVLDPLAPGAPTVVLRHDAVKAVLRVVAILRPPVPPSDL